MEYNPRGISFSKLEKATKKGDKYYVVAYWSDSNISIKTIEYLNKTQALKAHKRLKELGREHYVKECIFTADSWEEHAKNGLNAIETTIEG